MKRRENPTEESTIPTNASGEDARVADDRVVMFLQEGTPTEIAARMRDYADRVERGEDLNHAGNPRVVSRPTGSAGGWGPEESTYGRYHGVFADCEGASPALALFQDDEEAERYAASKHGADHAICRVDVCGSLWNSYDDDPHERAFEG